MSNNNRIITPSNDPYKQIGLKGSGKGLTGLPPAIAKKVMDNLKSSPRPAVFKVYPQFDTAPDGTILFVQVLRMEDPATGKPINPIQFDPIVYTLDNLKGFVSQMEDMKANPVPEWAQNYYNTKDTCPKCAVVINYALERVQWNEQIPSEYKDAGKVKCSCGWEGTIDDLKEHDYDVEMKG